MKTNDLLIIQATSGIAAIMTTGFTIISAAFMLVSIATGCVTLYNFFTKKKDNV